MGRSPCCDKMGLKKGSWMPEEDAKLLTYIQQNGHGNWHALPSKAGLRRCGKSCRLRWANYLRPDIKRGMFSQQEDDTIIQLHALLGNRWSAIAAHLPRRTDNEIKNYWNTHLKKRLAKMGIDPVTHKPTNQESDIRHMAQWEAARLEAEARSSKLDSSMKVSNLCHWEWANTHMSSALFNESPTVIGDLNYPSSMELHDIVHPRRHSAQLCYPGKYHSLGFQSSVKDDTPSIGPSYPHVVGGCWGVPEDDDNTLNAITRPVEARLYHSGKSSGKLGI